jgi:hypothetical protein
LVPKIDQVTAKRLRRQCIQRVLSPMLRRLSSRSWIKKFTAREASDSSVAIVIAIFDLSAKSAEMGYHNTAHAAVRK